jgi:hypothetical protein
MLQKKIVMMLSRSLPTFRRCVQSPSSRPWRKQQEPVNIGKRLPDYTAQRPRREMCSDSAPWEPEISLVNVPMAREKCNLFMVLQLGRPEIVYLQRFSKFFLRQAAILRSLAGQYWMPQIHGLVPSRSRTHKLIDLGTRWYADLCH